MLLGFWGIFSRLIVIGGEKVEDIGRSRQRSLFCWCLSFFGWPMVCIFFCENNFTYLLGCLNFSLTVYGNRNVTGYSVCSRVYR